MEAFKFGPKPTTITVAHTPPRDHPSAVTFTAPAETTTSRDFIFHFDSVVTGDQCEPDNDSENNDGGSDAAAADGESEKSEVSTRTFHSSTKTKKTCPPTLTAPHLRTTGILSLSHPSGPLPKTSAGSSASQPSSLDSSSASATNRLTTPSLTQSNSSSGPQGASASSTTSPSTTFTSTIRVSTSSTSSYSSVGISAANTSTRTPPASTSLLSSSASAIPALAAGLSTGATVGLALGVFAGTAVLVAAMVFLFLFFRARRRKRRCQGNRRGGSGSADFAAWKLTSSGSKGAKGRRLSSTWSLTVDSEPDDAEDKHEYGYGYGYGFPYGYRASPYSLSRDDGDPEKNASVGDWVARTTLGAEDTGSRAPRLPEPEGAPPCRPLSGTETTVSTLRFGPRKSGKKRTKDGVDMEAEVARRDDTSPLQVPRDPFADPRRLEIVRMLTTPT